MMSLSLSCSHESIVKDNTELEFVASWADTGNTRTAIQENGTSVWWTVSEEINLFYGNLSSGHFISTNAHPQETVAFRGSLDVVTGTIETGSAQPMYWAVYPYNPSNVCDGESVTLTVPTIQDAAENTFADKLFPAVARNQSFSLAFYHVCGGVRFSVEEEGIMGVTFKSVGGEALAGKVKVGFGPDGKPIMDCIINGIDEVTVRAPDQGFVPGKYYFASLLPGMLDEGLSVMLVKEGAVGIKLIDKSLKINRSRFGILDALDADVVFSGDVPPGSDVISFNDPGIKACLVAAFDANRDGEISYVEAAAATSLEGAFGGRTDFTSFDEFQFFTGITSVPSSAFSAWDQLESIRIPESVSEIGYYAFAHCTSLKSVILPEQLTAVMNSVFFGCTSLQSISLPDQVIDIGEYAFYGCSSLSEVRIPDSLKYIGNYAFYRCISLESVTLPSVLLKIGDRAFEQCESLLTLIIPDSVTSIGESVFFECKNLTEISLPVGLTNIPSDMFCGCTSLESIVLPEGITTIGEWAFASSGLKSIVFPSSLQTIGDSAFGRCHELSQVSLNEGLSRIQNNAFRECTSLTTISIPQSVEWLNDYILAYCSALSSCILTRATPTIHRLYSTTFEGSDNCLFYVPDDALDTYRSTGYWETYADRILPLSSLP